MSLIDGSAQLDIDVAAAEGFLALQQVELVVEKFAEVGQMPAADAGAMLQFSMTIAFLQWLDRTLGQALDEWDGTKGASYADLRKQQHFVQHRLRRLEQLRHALRDMVDRPHPTWLNRYLAEWAAGGDGEQTA